MALANSDQEHDVETEIAIAGGGLVGAALALGLAQSGISSAVIEAEPLIDDAAAATDGRASALGYPSWRMLLALGLGPELEPHAQPIDQILITDASQSKITRKFQSSPLSLHFDSREKPIGGPLGMMVENRHLRCALARALTANPKIRVLAPARIARLEALPAKARARHEDGRDLNAALVIGAEGRRSAVRAAMDVRLIQVDYEQTALVATLAHDRAHDGVAHQMFLPGGPVALLPLQGHRTCLVWSEKTAFAKSVLAQSPDVALREIRARIGAVLGEISLEGQLWSFPLSMALAETWVKSRLALAGDAAHAIHPIAGQGLNLGLRDAAALAETLRDARRSGADLGAETTLLRYQRWRRFDTATTAFACDAFNRLFSNAIAPVRLARRLGLAGVDAIGPLRRLAMQIAAGGAGDLPLLLRGEALAP